MIMFPAKLLLFGEYSILLGSSALSIPYNNYGASLRFIQDETGDLLLKAVNSNHQLQTMCEHFVENVPAAGLIIDFNSFCNDVSKGLYLDSNIPQRYGMGSSGALCAAVLQRFALKPNDQALGREMNNLVSLRNSFILLESFFHGRSSGFDPLVSFLNIPMLLRPAGELVPAAFHGGLLREKGIEVLLVDSGQPCSTGPLVSGFLVKFAPDGIIGAPGIELCRMVNSAIGKLPGADKDGLWNEIMSLSAFQLQHLNHLIPASFTPRWKEGLQTGLFTLKLCGSGGGGFLLCFTQQKEAALSYFNDRKIPVVSAGIFAE